MVGACSGTRLHRPSGHPSPLRASPRNTPAHLAGRPPPPCGRSGRGAARAAKRAGSTRAGRANPVARPARAACSLPTHAHAMMDAGAWASAPPGEEGGMRQMAPGAAARLLPRQPSARARAPRGARSMPSASAGTGERGRAVPAADAAPRARSPAHGRPTPTLPPTLSPADPQSQLACAGCRTVLLYPAGAQNVRCARCGHITSAAGGAGRGAPRAPPPPGADGLAQLVCSSPACRVVLMYPRGAARVQCSLCGAVNCAVAANAVGHAVCGGCSITLMFAHGASSVKCAVCNAVTAVGGGGGGGGGRRRAGGRGGGAPPPSPPAGKADPASLKAAASGAGGEAVA